jgi:hypothetical protein
LTNQYTASQEQAALAVASTATASHTTVQVPTFLTLAIKSLFSSFSLLFSFSIIRMILLVDALYQ